MTEAVGAAPSQKPAAASRLPGLDLLRFVAASLVVIYHFTYHPKVRGVVDADVFGSLQRFSAFGYLGVNLFFIISGFVILWSSQKRSAREFVISRVSRLYPSFWVAVVLTSLVRGIIGNEAPSMGTFMINLTMVPSLAGIEYVDGVYWTLFVEIKFYLLVFLVLVSGTMRHVERWVAVWLLANIVAALGYAPHILESVAMYPFAPFFISGCLLFLISSRGPSTLRIAALLISCALAALAAFDQITEFVTAPTTSSRYVAAGAVVVFHGLLALVTLRPTIVPRWTAFFWLGSLTYPLYLLHGRIGKVITSRLPAAIPNWMALGISLVVVCSLSVAVAIVVERNWCGKFQRLLTRQAGVIRSNRATA